MTQTQIAAAIGISQMHVSRLLLKTLAQLHDTLTTEPRPSKPTGNPRPAATLTRHTDAGHRGTRRGRAGRSRLNLPGKPVGRRGPDRKRRA
jgi:hypothetical protein